MTDFCADEKGKKLAERMAALNILEEDLEEDFIRAPGPGGQKINKTACCVNLRHRPTGIRVKCHAQRSQRENRYVARVRLCDKIEALIEEESRRKKAEQAARRRRAARRPARVKEKILEEKRKLSLKKASRARIRPESVD